MHPIKSVKAKDLAPGITGYYVHAERSTLGLVELKEGSSVPPHSHPHEQITYLLEGRLQMVLAGETCVLSAGDYLVIPSDAVHSAVALTDCQLIDTFTPVREEYKQ